MDTETPDPLSFLSFTWRRAAFVVILAGICFFIPQEVPLEWYPLNNPSSGLQYLEITCAANFTGETQIFIDFGRGIREIDKIQIPIGPSEMAFTYTFPLKDAPLHSLRIDPISSGAGELTITNLRLINRREEELHRITQKDFKDLIEMKLEKITPTTWKLVATPDSKDPRCNVSLPKVIVPEGMNERNLKRCLLSWSYLAGMLTLILSTILSIFIRTYRWSILRSPVAMMLVLTCAFSVVGNRGLIFNSIRSAIVGQSSCNP